MKDSDKTFSKYITISFGLHFAIFLLLTLKFVFFPTENLDYQRTVRIDVVALPDKIEQKPIAEKEKATPKVEVKKTKPKETPPVKKPQPKPKVKPKPKPKAPKKIKLKKKTPKKNVTKKNKEDQNSAIARLKAMKKLRDRKKDEVDTQKVEYKGNAISKGNALTGLEKLKHESYLGDLDSHIKNHWNLPEWLADGTLKARVLLLISKDGTIIQKSFIMKSGNNLFDQHVLGTLDKASPLPQPPKDLVDFFANKGVEIRFPE